MLVAATHVVYRCRVRVSTRAVEIVIPRIRCHAVDRLAVTVRLSQLGAREVSGREP